jgi:SAM-dependent methyltransferase
MLFEFKKSTCTLCGSNTPEPVSTSRIIRRSKMKILSNCLDEKIVIVRCSVCSHHYLDPAPTEESLDHYYNEDYFCDDDSAPDNVSNKLRLSDCFYFMSCRKPTILNGRLLDIGSGNKKYLLWASQKGYQAEGFDYSEYPGVEGSEAIPMSYGVLKSDSFEPESFDVITLWWILEHVKNPVEILSYCKKFLKPEGVIMIGVPNFGSPLARIFGDYWHHLVLPDHISQFTSESAVNMVERAGMKVEKVKYDILSFDIISSIWDYFYYGYGWNLPLLNFPMRALALPFGYLFSFFHLTGNMTLVAKKKNG